MGFRLPELDLSDFSPAVIRRFAGNTVHVGVAGPVILALMLARFG